MYSCDVELLCCAVYSFGVVLWQLRGLTDPHEDLSAVQILTEVTPILRNN